MPSKLRSKLMPTLNLLLSMTMGALPLTLLSGCATTVKDFQACAVVPGGAYGAACDNFLSSNQQILDEAQWQALQDSWLSQGEAVECLSSGSLADLKGELEKLCSETSCDYEQTQAVSTTLSGLDRMIALRAKSRALSPN